MDFTKLFYIDGKWVDPVGTTQIQVVNPATENSIADVALGAEEDIDRAVKAARRAFSNYSATSPEQRVRLLERILEAYQEHVEELAQTLTSEMGAPISFARQAQVPLGMAHLRKMIEVLRSYEFEYAKGSSLIVEEAIGVCGLITPWNWPINQIMCKVVPALAAGCTMVLKPSEVAPLNAIILARIFDQAGVPEGVFNMVQGEGAIVGEAISSHPDIDMVSFTGSTRAGVLIAKSAANTVKRVHQELGGKSANIILPDADLKTAVTRGLHGCYRNAGQTCTAPTRMYVHRSQLSDVIKIAQKAAEQITVGDPTNEMVELGPLVSDVHYQKVQAMIKRGCDEGAELVSGGPGRPEGLEQGYFAQPTIFARVTSDMTIAQEEIFGPVLSILSYDNEEEVISLANSSNYGLAAYVQSSNLKRARNVARRMRAGSVQINYPPFDAGSPFGGYKQSGNGREYAEFGLAEYLEVKGLVGYAPAE
ncbi:aldehyde dehydrogenase family protein [Marinobacter salarius]|uniref:aldehyde dehydrogenase family protein n=1 Tax=Marinobacter salarius TaxID=1420917 RepID=UPI0032EBDDBD